MRQRVFNGSKDYGKLSHLPFNRNFKTRQSLVDSMNKYGFVIPIILLETTLISGKKELYVLDGQHRAITASFLDIPFYGVVLTELDFENIPALVEFIAAINSSQKAWNVDDYVSAYAYLNMEHYKTLQSVTQKSPFTTPTIASMLTGFRSRGKSVDKIKDGSFEALLYNETLETVSIAAKLSKTERVTSRMGLAIHYVSSLVSFDYDKFETKYIEHAKKVKELKLDDYSDLFLSWLK